MNIKNILLLIFMSIAYTSAHGQLQTRPIAKHGDNLLTISLLDSTSRGRHQIGQVLVRQGFAIIHSDAALSTFVACRPGLSQPAILLTASLQGRTLLLKGYTGPNNADQLLGQGELISYAQSNSGSMRKAWDQLIKLAEELGGKVTYSQ